MSSDGYPAGSLPAYMAITANEGKRVVLPLGAAGRARLLHDLLDGLHVMGLAMAAKSADNDNDNNNDKKKKEIEGTIHFEHRRGDLYSLLMEEEQQKQQQRPADGAAAAISFSGGGEDEFTCFARAYPLFHRLPPSSSSDAFAGQQRTEGPCGVVTSAGNENEKTRATAAAAAIDVHAALLEVPLGCVEGDTMARIAEFLVLKSCAAVQQQSHGSSGYLHKADPLKDLDCTSQNDHLTAIRLLLGSDLLGC